MLLIAYGTRPEWLKVKPVIAELQLKKIEFMTLFTGQHNTLVETYPTFHFNISEDNSVDRLSHVLSRCIYTIAGIVQSNPKITHVMVQGDTTSALGIALGAYHNKISVIHLEAGLRTYDLNNPYPEEANRQMISRIASIHLCPTHQNEINLTHELVSGTKYVVGNTALDNLLPYVGQCEFENKILVTLHRRENHDTIQNWFEMINHLAKRYDDHEFILPLHPNPNVKKHSKILTNVKVIEPLNHADLLNILIKCKFVITDSGGIQEECSFLGKKAIVCRKETERPEAIGYTTELCENPDELATIVRDMMNNFEVDENHASPFGDGHSAKKIVKILKDIIK